jgi:hypothetical protein
LHHAIGTVGFGAAIEGAFRNREAAGFPILLRIIIVPVARIAFQPPVCPVTREP